MKITKTQLKQIIKEELELNEVDNTRPEKILGDIHVRLGPIIEKLKAAKRVVKGKSDELEDFLHELQSELKMYQRTTHKYKDSGEIR